MQHASKYSVALLDSSVSSLLLANLLEKKGVSTIVFGNANKQTWLNGDFIFNNKTYNLSVSSLQDVDGIVDFTLKKLDINIYEEIEIDQFVELLITKDNQLIYRNKSIDLWVTELSQKFPYDSQKIKDFFSIITGIGNENWVSLMDDSVNLAKIPLFVKYFRYSYKKLIDEFCFSDTLNDLLMSYAPWDGISLITMSGYWLQLTSVASIDDGLNVIHEKLLNKLTDNKSILIDRKVSQVYENECGNFTIVDEVNDNYIVDRIVTSGDGCWLKDLGIEVENDFDNKDRFKANISIVETGQVLSSFVKNDVNRIKFDICIDKKYFKILLSYIDSKFIKMEIKSDHYITDYKTILKQIQIKLKAIGYDDFLKIKKVFTLDELKEITGFSDGYLDKWAHSCKDILNNPLKKIEAAKNSYALGDWGNGFFYSAEIYSRELVKKSR